MKAPAAWKYRRDYERRCRECGHPIVGAARNQRLHEDCRDRATARRKRLRRECCRAARGLFPGDRVPLEQIRTDRRTATPATRRRYYAWNHCVVCEERFFAGLHAKYCLTCTQRRRRERSAVRGRHWMARQPAHVLERRRRRAAEHSRRRRRAA